MQCHSGTIPSKALAVLNSSIAGHYERARCLYIQDKRNRSVYVEKISKFANCSKILIIFAIVLLIELLLQ